MNRLERAGMVILIGFLPSIALAATPKVTKTSPATEAADVDPGIDQIVITFDTPMKPDGWSIVQVGDAAVPDMVGDEPISFRDARTCVVKVKLNPDTAYGLGINSKTRQGFKSADGTPAEPFQLKFKTGSGKASPVPDGPRVVKTEPADRAKDLEAGTFDLTIVFSEPMKQGQASVSTPEEGPHLKLVGKPAWKDSRTFVVPIMLAPGTTYRVGINTGESKQFASAGDGTPAAPLTIVFSTQGAARGDERQSSRDGGTEPGQSPRLRYNYRKGDAGRVKQQTAVDIQLNLSSGQTLPIAQKSGINCIEEVLATEKGLPVEVRKIISEFLVQVKNPQDGQVQSAPPLENPVTVKVNRRGEQAQVEPESGELPETLASALASDSFPAILPSKPVAIGEVFEPAPETLRRIQKAFDPTGGGEIRVKLTLRGVRTREVPDARNEMFKAKGGGEPVSYLFDVADIAIDWTQSGKMENDIPFAMSAKGSLLFAIEPGVMLNLDIEGKIEIKPSRIPGENGETVTIAGGGTYRSQYSYEPIKWSRGVKRKAGSTSGPVETTPAQQSTESDKPDGRATPSGAGQSGADARDREDTAPIPADWTHVDDKLFGTRVAVPPGWTPRVRGESAFCVEPGDVPKAGVFFLPILLKGRQSPDELADGFDNMLRRAMPTLETKPSNKPTPESVQRDLVAQSGDVRLAGAYRAVAGNKGTGLIMGYIAPADQLDRLKPVFFRVLGSYRYTGPKMRLQPFKSTAIELRIPPGWQVRTSEGNGTANQDIDWEVSCPQVPGSRAFMYSPKFFSPSWITDALTGQIDQQLLPLWQNKGFQLANFAGDQQAIQTAVLAALPGFEVVRQQSLDEVRDFFTKLMEVPIQTAQIAGGRMNIHVIEFVGRRNVQGVEMRTVTTIAVGALVVQKALTGPAALWMTGMRGFEAPAAQFAQLAPTLDKITGTFNYTTWWLREVMKANEQQAQTMRNLYADIARLDKEIFDNRMKTNSAINEMAYDTLTENYGYLNEKTGTIEKIPADRLDAFRNQNGDVVSPEDVIAKHIAVRDATPLREAGADDYMSFDRRAQVWP